jgi:hypothetical protein
MASEGSILTMPLPSLSANLLHAKGAVEVLAGGEAGMLGADDTRDRTGAHHIADFDR